MPFEIDNYVYDSELLIAYCNIFKPKTEKISMNSPIILDNVVKKEWFSNKYSDGLSILDVIDNKKKYPNHYKRMLNADTKYPIIIWKEKNLVIDGNHRLGNAIINDHKYIKAYVFDNKLMKKFRIGKFSNRRGYNKIVEKINPNFLITLFYKRFVE